MKKDKLRIGLILDNPKRDLKGLLILSSQLLEAGHSVVVIPMYYQVIDTFLADIDCLVVNYARLNNKAFLASCKEVGIKLYVLDTEGGVLSKDNLDSPKSWARYMDKNGLNQYLEGYFFWGSNVHKAFVEYSNIAPSNLYKTGCPRYDQCHPSWRKVLKSNYDGHVLVNTNFSAINPAYSGGAEAEKKSFLSVGWEEKYVDTIYEQMQALFPNFIEQIKGVAKALPQKKVVIRPHPFENAKFYDKTFGEFDNVVVDPRGDVFDAIAGASCIIHLNCGTAIDSFMMGVTPISIEYLNNDFLSQHTPLPSKVSYQAQNLDDLIEAVSGPEEKMRQLEAQNVYQHHIEEFFYLNDGKAGERVAQTLSRNARAADKSAFSQRVSIVLKQNFGFVHRLYKLASIVLGTRVINKLRQVLAANRASKELQLNSVKAYMHAIGESMGLQDKWLISHQKGILPFAKMASIVIENKA